MNTSRLVLTLLLTTVTAPAFAQSKPAVPASGKRPAAPAKATPSQVRLAQLQDRRSNGPFARCTLGIELPDVRAIDLPAARVLVTKAVDDLGTNLVPDDAAQKVLEATQRGQLGADDGKTVAIVFAEMKNPPRKAKALAEVSGEIELYMPGRDPSSEARFPKLLSWSGKALVHPSLQTNGIDIAYLSAPQLAAERKKAETAERTKLKKDGHTDEAEIKELVDDALDSFPKGKDGDIVLRVRDPKKVLQDITLLDGQGNPAFAAKSEDAGLTTLSFFSAKPKADWSLKVLMRSSKSLVRETFVFKDVPLP